MTDPTQTLRVFPFRYKLTILIAAIVTAVLVAIYIVVSRYIEAEFRELIVSQLEQTDRYVSEKMADRYEHLLGSALMLSDDKLVLDILTDEALSHLTRNDILAEEIFPGLINVDALVVLDDSGALMGHSLDSTGMATRLVMSLHASSWFQSLLKGAPNEGYVDLGGSYYQCVGMPVFVGEEMLGIVVASRELNGDQLVQIKETSGADIAILKDGATSLSTIWTWSRGDETLERFMNAFDAWLADTHRSDGGGMRATEVVLLGERFLLREVIDSSGFMPPYVVVQSLDRRLEFLDDLKLSAMAVGLAGLVAGIGLGFVMALTVSRPIRLLQTATREVERENLAFRVVIETNDEFAELGRSFNRMTAGLAEKKRIRAALDKSVSPEVADHILSADAALGGELRRATILFADIRDFTTLAERLDPESLIALINAYFTRINHCIHSHHGIVDKFIGDAVMALFGAPVDRPHHALDAIRAAQDMLSTLQTFNREEASKFGCELSIGIGINTGKVVAGLVGSEDRLGYTAVGDDVNLASRLEGLTVLYGAKIVLGDATLQELRSTDARELAELPIRALDRVQVKGKRNPVEIHELLTRSEPVSELQPQLELYQQARRCLAKLDWSGARMHLESILADSPLDTGARALLDRCDLYAAHPGHFGRDYHEGVRVLTTK